MFTGSCADVPLLNSLPKSQIRSDLDTSTKYASFAKMSEDDAWCIAWYGRVQDIYLEIDFRFLHKVCAVATKGLNDRYVGPYNVLYSKDGRTYSYSSIFGSRVVSIASEQQMIGGGGRRGCVRWESVFPRSSSW